MPIPRYLEDVGAFDPDVIKAMSAALEKACAVLHIGNQILDREAIATRVIDLARNGIVDANTLAQRVIAETEAMSALTTVHKNLTMTKNSGFRALRSTVGPFFGT